MTRFNPINDILLRLGVKDSVQVDLKAAFGDAYTTFSIKSSDRPHDRRRHPDHFHDWRTWVFRPGCDRDGRQWQRSHG